MSGPIIINESNLNTGIVLKEQQIIYSSFYWHKIFVQNAAQYSRDYVLKIIMNAVYPHDFIPVQYTVENDFVTFMLKNCGAAINELCRLNLTIPHPDIQKALSPFKFAITLKHANASEIKIDIQKNVMGILRKRYNGQTKTLNLESFMKDPDLIEYCPFSQSKLMYFVLHLAKDFDIESLKLSFNEIENIKGLEALHNDRIVKSMTILDLKKNNIKYKEELEVLKLFQITELTIEENPFCENMNESDYLKIIRNYCPKILKLDGLRIPPFGRCFRRNYLCNNSGQTLIDNFIDHFFTIYDSKDRHLLANMYYKNALFSLTAFYNFGPGPNNLFEYKKRSRNLKTISDFSKCEEFIFHGPNNIENIFKTLPATEHDPYTFTVDLTYLHEQLISLTITGVFKELGDRLLASEFDFSFMRTFVIRPAGNSEYLIQNDMLHVCNTSTTQQAQAFKSPKATTSKCINIPNAIAPMEQKDMISAFVAITCLHHDWARKCLIECDFNLKQALILFNELFKTDRIPLQGFIFNNKHTNNITTLPALTPSQTAQRRVKQNPNVLPVSVAPNVRRPPGNEVPRELLTVKECVAVAKSSTVKTSAVDGSDETLSTDIGDFKKYVKDPVILKCLNFSIDTSIETVKMSLDEAGKCILKNYTFAIKYYKAIGREFYRFQLYSNARMFLTSAMGIVPKQMGEQLYCIFTLLEIQYGDLKVAENMVLIIAETMPIEKTAHFVGVEVSRINASFARELFEAMCITNLVLSKKDVLTKKFVEFEMFYGNVETLKRAKKCVENLHGPTKTDIKSDSRGSSTSKKTENYDHIIEIIEDAPYAPVTKDAFQVFYTNLLIRANMLPNEMKNPKIDTLHSTDKIITAVSVGEELLAEFKEEYCVVRSVVHAWLKFAQLRPKIDEVIMKAKNISFDLNRKMTPLTQFLKIRDEIVKGNLTEAKDKLANYLRITPHMSLSPVVELIQDLTLDTIDCTSVLGDAYAAVLKNVNLLPAPKMNLYILLYLGFCLQHNLSHADELYNTYHGYQPFYPEDIAEMDFIKYRRIIYEDNRPNIPKESVLQSMGKLYMGKIPVELQRSTEEISRDSFHAQVEEMRMHYHLNHFSKARQIRNCFKSPDTSEVDRFKLASAYYEALYGVPTIAKKILQKLNLSDFNVKFVQLFCTYQCDEPAAIKAQLKKIFEEINTVMNPHAQRLLFKYHKEWERIGFNIFSDKYN